MLRSLSLGAALLAASVLPAAAQMRVEIRPANFRFDPAGATRQTFEVHLLNYTNIEGYSIPVFFDPTVLKVISTARRGELMDDSGGAPQCIPILDNPRGIVQVDCSTFENVATIAGADGVAFTFVMERVAPGTSGLTFSNDYYLYKQDLRLRDRPNAPRYDYTVGDALATVDRPLPAAGAMRVNLDFSTDRRDSVDAALIAVGTTGVKHRVRNNGTGGRLTVARYDAAPPGGDGSPFSDPDGTITSFGTVARYWELTSSFTGTYLQDLAFSYAGLTVFDPSQLRLARRTITDDGTGAWQVYPSAKTAVNPATQEVTLTSASAADVVTGQFALVANATSLPVELVGFTGRADGSSAALAWETASETNNAGFVVEQRGSAGWSAVSPLIAGQGTTTERHAYAYRVDGIAPGRHAFRLRQTDTDGTVHTSGTVEVEVGLDVPYRVQLRGPNPVHSRLDASVFVAHAQTLRLSLVDATGREAFVLFDGRAEAGAPLDVRVDASTLSSGLYWLRGAGERVHFAHPVVVAR